MHPVHFLLCSVSCHPVPILLLFSCRLTASPSSSFNEHHPLLPSSQPPRQCRSSRKQPFPHTTWPFSAVSCFLLNLCLLFSALHNSVLPPNQAFCLFFSRMSHLLQPGHHPQWHPANIPGFTSSFKVPLRILSSKVPFTFLFRGVSLAAATPADFLHLRTKTAA